jgi:hypothetical protein
MIMFLFPRAQCIAQAQNTVVLEISATPYIFTFKLWDWGRMGLDGKPRPISLEHGKNVIQWNRTKEWTEKEYSQPYSKKLKKETVGMRNAQAWMRILLSKQEDIGSQKKYHIIQTEL